jgi:hypothetical protein
MAEPLTVYRVVEAAAEHIAARIINHTSRDEVAQRLGVKRPELDPLFDEAVEAGYLAVHDRYSHNYVLTDAGQGFLDAAAFG